MRSHRTRPCPRKVSHRLGETVVETIPGIRFYQVKFLEEKKRKKRGGKEFFLSKKFIPEISATWCPIVRPGTEGELVSPLGIDLEKKQASSLLVSLRFRLRAGIIQRSTTPEPSSEIRRWNRKRVHLPPEFFLFRHRHLPSSHSSNGSLSL